MGRGNQTTAWIAGKVTNDEFGFAAPYKIYGLKRKPSYTFTALTSVGGSLSSNIDIGYSGEIATITAIPESNVWKMIALNITGAELTGNDFMFSNSNVTAQAEFEHSRNLTLENGDHGVLSADKMSGFSGDVVTVDATTDEGWYLSAIALTGAEATGFKFMFTGSDVTALGEYTDVGFPITYETTEGGTCTGDTQIFIPGSEGITLQTAYDTYYRFSGYDITGGSIVDGKLVPTGPCTAKAVYKVNAFTASGGWEKGSDVNCNSNYYASNANVPQKYATAAYKTNNVPSEWYEISNRWKPNGASAYSMTANPIMKFSAGNGSTVSVGCTNTAISLIDSTQTATGTVAYTLGGGGGVATGQYNKTFTTTTQNVYYSISAKINYGNNGSNIYGTAAYIASGTTGTWTATGIAP